MKKDNVILLRLSPGELWHSLSLNSRELAKKYQKEIKNPKTLFWSNNNAEKSVMGLIKLLTGHEEIKIIVIDPQIPISEIILKINQCKIKQAYLVIHGYGDFIRQLSPIKRAYKSNQVNISVTAYFPSLRTCQAFKNIFNTSQGIYYAPVIYPKLLTKRCAYTRPEFNKSGHKIGYFGRIEQSKNLIETIMLLDKNNFFNTGELFVAGEIDLHHYHFSQKHKDSNFLLRLTHFINDLDSRTKSKIHFIGNLNSNELAYFIKKMNIIINLSTFYGECFGISVRQALDLKTPVIASNWGGFHDIQNNSLVELIPISPGKSGVRKFSSSHFSKALRKLLLLPHKTMKARTEKKSRFLKSPKIFVLSNFTVPDEKKWKAFMAGID